MININKLEDILINLWQGKGIDINELISFINGSTEIIVNSLPKLKESGIEFPIEYIKAAMKNMYTAIETTDDYMLADNIYYEWKEIFCVYNETLTEYGE